MGKDFWKSKTLWFNLIFLVVTLAGVFGYAEFQPSQDVQQIGLVLVLAVNLILRWLTTQPLTRFWKR